MNREVGSYGEDNAAAATEEFHITSRAGGRTMSSLYAMRRANGDWFALDEGGRFRVPLFGSRRGGMLACVTHWGMLLFKPVALDGGALEGLVTTDGAGETDFWLVDDPFTSLKRGRLIDRAQLSLLVRDAS